MQIIKKQITKDDGRLLIYYHFPKSATEEQKAAFEGIEAEPQAVAIEITTLQQGEVRERV